METQGRKGFNVMNEKGELKHNLMIDGRKDEFRQTGKKDECSVRSAISLTSACRFFLKDECTVICN